MEENAPPLDRPTAAEYAAWFRALADGTRVQVVSLLARSGQPMTVKQIVAAVPVASEGSATPVDDRDPATVRFGLIDLDLDKP